MNEQTRPVDQEIIDNNPHLFVVKSISKSYGVPGLRLGVLVSGDKHEIERLKKDVAIWNINSFGEFYMQIEEKYKKFYITGLEQFKAERSRFQSELSKIKGLKVITSQANYIMIKLETVGSRELTKLLFERYNLLIKDISMKKIYLSENQINHMLI